VVTLAFTALGRFVRGVSPSGAIAGAVICFVLFVGAGSAAFVALVSVFILTWTSTRLGYGRKQRLGTAQSREGRSASQVLANLAISATCAACFAITKNAAWLIATAAALSEAAADTVSSELGQAGSAKARLITSWKVVPAGTDGGVSMAGTLGGIAGALLVTLVCVGGGMLPLRQTAASVMAALFGMIADSYLGATLERRKLLNNDSVNFLGTLVAAGGALLLA
jgi:uncharacterized protein (TIGR00297 family)